MTEIAASQPDWRADQMRAGFDVFESLAEPTGVEEDWRYVDYDIPFSGLSPVVEAGEALPPGPFLSAAGATSEKATIVDGKVISNQITATQAQTFDDAVRQELGRVPVDHNKLAAAHMSFADDGLFIDVSDGTVVDAPLLIDVQGVTPDSASFPQLSIHLGSNSELSVIVAYRSPAGVPLLMVPNVDLAVGAGANLKMLSVQALDHAASVVVHQRMALGRDATGRLGEVGLGADFGRLDVAVDLEGDGASSEIVGLYFGEGSQTLDYRMVINHSGKNTSSDVFLKGAVEDDSQSVFTGLLRIEKDATRTSTFETNRNLVLSENAKANSVPNLEILCDDVICGHGSSVGPLEEDHLYYLQSRGLSRQRAERLLIKGFFQETIDRLPVSGLDVPISDEVFSRFAAAQAEGRVS